MFIPGRMKIKLCTVHKHKKNITKWSWAITEKPPFAQILKNFPTFTEHNVLYHVHKSLQSVPIFSQINPIHTIPSYLRSISILPSHLRLGFPNGSSWFSHQNPTCIPVLPIRTLFPILLILLDLFILIIVGEGPAVAYLVEAICYKPKGREFESRWARLFQFT
jgi:hypothetical protein